MGTEWRSKSFGMPRKSHGGPVTYYCETCHAQISPFKVIRRVVAGGPTFTHMAVVLAGKNPFSSFKQEEHDVLLFQTHPSEV